MIDHLLSDPTACLLTTSRNIPPKKLHHAKRPGWDPTLKSVSRLCKYHYRAWVRAGRCHSAENHLRIAYNPPREPSGHAYVYRENASTTYFTIRWTPTSILGDSFFLFVIAPPPTVTNQSLLESQSMALNTPTETSRKAGPHYFETLGTPPNLAHFPLPDIYRVISEIPNPEPDWVPPEDTSTIIHSLPRNKAAGLDHLTNEHLSFADDTLAPILSTIFNVILATGHIPPIFQQGLIIPIPKCHNIDL